MKSLFYLLLLSGIPFQTSYLKINESGEVITANEELDAEIQTRIKANEEYYYDIARKNQEYHMIIRKITDRKPELVFSGGASVGKADTAEINKRRKEWMELCNAHNASTLVNEMYAKEALYYNHKPLIRGREALAKEYSYMNREKYHLRLNPQTVTPVNEKLVFEIGQCSGSYRGKYIIIWGKEKGSWNILFDSNI